MMRPHHSFCAIASFFCACASNPQTKPDKPVSTVEKKLADDPNNAQVNVQMGLQSEATGDLLRAEQYYLRAEALGVPESEIGPRILRVLSLAHRYDEALERCRKRLAVAPDDRATRYVEAALLVALDRPKEAEHELNALQRSEPKDPQSYLALGRIYRDGNDLVRARQMFEKYLELAPNGESAAAVRFELSDEPPASRPEPEKVQP
jgi:tetratricopeptide (TPR) repeat protein